jgi:uncharacterized protein YcgI (DUF1989 family)
VSTPQGTITNFSQLTGALAAISGTQANLCALVVVNPNASAAYLQLFDAPATGQNAPTLGTTAPKLSIMIPAGQTLPLVLPEGQQVTFFSAITAAATTTPAGNVAPAEGIAANFILK